MSEIDRFDLLSGTNIQYDGICILRSPTLNDIREIGYAKYNSYISLLCLDIDKYIKMTGINQIKRSDIRVFDLLISDASLRGYLCDALSFFVSGDIEFIESYKAYKVTCNETPGIINRNNFESVQNGILQTNCVSVKKPNKKLKFRNKYAQELYEECGEDGGTIDPNMSLPNLIASIVAYHGAYTYENIWSLTVYQLYDLFFRINSKTQLGILGLRWAAWGKEDFDFSVWYKDIHENVKEI